MAPRKKDSSAKPRIKYVRTTITIPEEIFKKAQQNAAERGFAASMSGYLAWLCDQAEKNKNA